MVKEALTELGLSDKESAVYLSLLRHGTRSTSFIAHKTSLNRGTTYVILHSLLGKGLVVKSTKQKVQCFTALEPKALVDYVERREQELSSAKEHLQSVMGELQQLVNPLTTRPKIEFLDGVEGARIALLETLNNKERELRAFLSIADMSAFIGPEFFAHYTKRRIAAGVKLLALRTLEKDKEALATDVHAKYYMTDRRQMREVRYLSEELAFPINTYIFDDKLAIISSKEEKFALIIQSRELCQMQRKLFMLLWESALVQRKVKRNGTC